MKSLIITVALCSRLVFADPCDPSRRIITGNKAQKIITAMKLAQFKSTRVDDQSTGDVTFTYSAPRVSAATKDADFNDDYLSSYWSDHTDNEAAAKILYDSLLGANVFEDHAMGGNFFVDALDVDCSTAIPATPERGLPAVHYMCEMTAIWSDTCDP